MLYGVSDRPGQYEVTVPIILNEQFEKPYMFLTLLAELKHARLWFDPMAIVLTPVPLQTEVVVEFQILAANYTKWVSPFFQHSEI